MSHDDYPITITITFKDKEEPNRTFHCDELAFLDPLGEWQAIIVDDLPVFSIPTANIMYVEYVYDKKESKEKVCH